LSEDWLRVAFKQQSTEGGGINTHTSTPPFTTYITIHSINTLDYIYTSYQQNHKLQNLCYLHLIQQTVNPLQQSTYSFKPNSAQDTIIPAQHLLHETEDIHSYELIFSLSPFKMASSNVNKIQTMRNLNLNRSLCCVILPSQQLHSTSPPSPPLCLLPSPPFLCY